MSDKPEDRNPKTERSPKRFVLMDETPAKWRDQPRSRPTRWWQDTWRPLSEKDEMEAGYRYIAVEVYAEKDPNDYRPCKDMRLLFTDQCEYYVVCQDCRSVYGHMQWSGGTRGLRGWRGRAELDRADHENTKGWCEFCDPIFGNGGWRLG